MFSNSQYKQILGIKANNLTEQEIQELRDIQYKLANFIFDIWYEKHNKRKKLKEPP